MSGNESIEALEEDSRFSDIHVIATEYIEDSMRTDASLLYTPGEIALASARYALNEKPVHDPSGKLPGFEAVMGAVSSDYSSEMISNLDAIDAIVAGARKVW